MKFKDKTESRLIFAVMLGIFCFSFMFNNLHVVTHYIPLDSYSLATFIRPTILDKQYGFLYPLVDERGQFYLSQFGLHGRIYQFLYSALPLEPDRLTISLQRGAGFMFCVLLAGLLLHLRPVFGTIPVLISAVLLSLSPRLIQYANDIYWLGALALLPMFLVAALYDPSGMSKKGRILPWALLLASYVKFLCGYEFVSTIALAPIFFVLLREPTREWFSWRVIRAIMLMSAALVGGFALAMATHLIQVYFVSDINPVLYLSQQGRARSVGEAYQALVLQDIVPGRIQQIKQALVASFGFDEGAVSAFLDTIANGYWKSGATIILSYFTTTMIGTVNNPAPYYYVLPFGGGVPFVYGLLIAIILLPVAFLLRRTNASLEWLPRTGIVAILSILAPMSWYILGFGHSIIHSFVTVTLLFLPLAVLCMLFAVATVSEIVRAAYTRFQPIVSRERNSPSVMGR
ncbi:hypothetical protein JKG68_13925 [Microvirga aerilata]|uniref:Uncharacterized protein n=1 Tax=Microvirga aerilata TaxID=670292 RepID=A0A936Z905_9HYPH|nr:hypothetical protein [Microvirga aerilata]MBL0405071.1 hypothetical protein [Microvirga aerilata]